jgi:hypothetical protein
VLSAGTEIGDGLACFSRRPSQSPRKATTLGFRPRQERPNINSMSRRPILIASLLLAVAGVLFLPRLCRHRPTDEEQILALFADAARAAEEKRIGDAVRGVSERFAGEGLDKRGVKQLVAANVLRGTWVSVAIAGAKVGVQGDDAHAVVDVIMSRSGKGRPVAELLPERGAVHRFSLRLAREDDGWRVTSAAWHPISVEEAITGPELPPTP